MTTLRHQHSGRRGVGRTGWIVGAGVAIAIAIAVVLVLVYSGGGGGAGGY